MKQETINQIKLLKEQGKRPIEISRELNLPYSTILYYCSSEYRKNKINDAKEYQKKNKPKRTDKLRAYQREYHKKYYQRKKEVKAFELSS